MKNQLQKCTVIKTVLFAALLGFGGAAWAAQVAGVVARLSGPLMVKKADGSVKVLALRSEIESGDTLVSEKNTYAQIKFIDNSEITLRPGTTFKVENFAYDAARPEGDSANFSLVKGGLRSITGLMGKRNKEKFSLKTPSATIGIRGTTFVAQYVPPQGAAGVNLDNSLAGLGQQAGAKVARGPDGPAGIPVGVQGKAPVGGVAAAARLAPGLHVQVSDGMIVVTNQGGVLNFAAGQFGFVPNLIQPPVIVPANPGLQFTPPPAFNASVPGASGAGPARSDANQVDCEVR